MQRRDFLGFVVGATAAWPRAVRAQQRERKINRIGFLAFSEQLATPDVLTAIRTGLRERGYVEGQNIAIEYRYAGGRTEKFPAAVAELVALNVDVIIAWATSAVVAAKQGTSTVPIVMVGVADPVGSGLVKSLSRPGGNVTGMSNYARDVSSKSIELLADMVPDLKRVAMLFNPGNVGLVGQRSEIEAAARFLNVTLLVANASVAADLEGAFARIDDAGSQGVVALADPMFLTERKQIAERAVKSRLPTVFQRREYVEAGGLASYGSNVLDEFRHAGVYVDKILQGAHPADLPVEQPTKLELVINQKTAKALGITVPPTLLGRADEVIE